MFREFLKNIKKKRTSKNIEKLFRKELISLGINVAIKNNFVEKEIEGYEIYYKTYGVLHDGTITRMEELGLMKKALYFSKLEPRKNLASKTRVTSDLNSNDSYKISQAIFLKPEFKNSLAKELYYAHENGDYSSLKEKVIEYNFLEEISIIPRGNGINSKN